MSEALLIKASHKKFLALAYFLGVVHLIFGIIKLTGQPHVIEEFIELWHFPLWFMYFLGVAQLIGGIALFTPQLRKPASLALAMIMIGAIVINIISLNIGNIIICTVILISCALVYLHRFES